MIEEDSQRAPFKFPDRSDRSAGMERLTYYVLDSWIHYLHLAAKAWLITLSDRLSVEITHSYREERRDKESKEVYSTIPRSIFEMHHGNRTTNPLKTKNGSMKEDGTRACLNVFGLERSQAQRHSQGLGRRLRESSQIMCKDNTRRD